MERVEEMRDSVGRALLEVEDNVEPFRGKRVTKEALVSLLETAVHLRKTLQDAHLYLAAHDAEEYDANFRTKVTDCRRLLSAFIVELEEQKVAREAEFTAAGQQSATATAADEESKRRAARQALIATRATRVLTEAENLSGDCESFWGAEAATDEKLYEKAENHKALCSRLEAAAAACKELADLALQYDLLEESGKADTAASKLSRLRLRVDQAMLVSRRDAGVWAEKARRTATRGDHKMPNFSGSATERSTVYEFERDWAAYKAALGLTVEEALKELKLAVLPPARAAVTKMDSEDSVFKYLRSHYGNPVLLLNARVMFSGENG
jgi:hypothetical protein